MCFKVGCPHAPYPAGECSFRECPFEAEEPEEDKPLSESLKEMIERRGAKQIKNVSKTIH